MLHWPIVMRGRFVLGFLFAVGISSSALAQTEVEQPFDAAYEAANALASEGKWDQAAKKFAEAAALRPTAVTIFNWAQAERNAGNASVARAQFARAKELAKKEGAEDIVLLSEQALGELQDKVGRIALVLPPGKNVSVSVDGRPVTPKGGEIEVKPGEHRLVVSAAGEPTFVRIVRVHAGQSTGVAVHFKEGVQNQPDVRREAAPLARTRASGPPTLSVVLGGVGAAALTGGLVFHVYRNNKLEQAASKCTRTGDGWTCPAGTQADPKHRDARDAADTALVVRNVLLGVGAAAVISGATLWLTMPSEEKVQVSAVPLPGGAAGSARFRF